MENIPEKIYLREVDLVEVGNCLSENNDKTDIEYTRTDAFVEKAVEFIGLNVCDYINVTHKGGIEHLELQERFIRNFKNYMKGE